MTFICANCHREYTVATAEAEAHGWTIFTVEHLGCQVAPRPRRDIYDFSQWTAAEKREMREQAEGMENVSR